MRQVVAISIALAAVPRRAASLVLSPTATSTLLMLLRPLLLSLGGRLRGWADEGHDGRSSRLHCGLLGARTFQGLCRDSVDPAHPIVPLVVALS